MVGTVCARIGLSAPGVVLRGEVDDLAAEYGAAAMADAAAREVAARQAAQARATGRVKVAREAREAAAAPSTSVPRGGFWEWLKAAF